jgi:hypothetical protein
VRRCEAIPSTSRVARGVVLVDDLVEHSIGPANPRVSRRVPELQFEGRVQSPDGHAGLRVRRRRNVADKVKARRFGLGSYAAKETLEQSLRRPIPFQRALHQMIGSMRIRSTLGADMLKRRCPESSSGPKSLTRTSHQSRGSFTCMPAVRRVYERPSHRERLVSSRALGGRYLSWTPLRLCDASPVPRDCFPAA